MQRRTLLKSAATLAFAAAAKPALPPGASSIPTIDSHIHLFDPTRPGGVPWPAQTDAVLYRPALPSRYARLSQAHHVVGAIAVECSPWLVDNFWLQDVVQRSPLMLGFIGNLLPEAPDFPATLDRLHRSPLFLGIRYGNLWNRDLGAVAHNPEFLSGLKLLAQTGLVLETANPDPSLLAAALRVSDHVPELHIVIDHLPHLDPPVDPAARTNYESHLRELARRSTVYVKVSEILRRVDGLVSLDPSRYRDSLDELWERFGEDRVCFGSDWPNSDSLASFDETIRLAKTYIATRSVTAQQKYLWKNSLAVYKWHPRAPLQAQLKMS